MLKSVSTRSGLAQSCYLKVRSIYLSILIESNDMKRLITPILYAALLFPMWASAQTKTTPSILGQLNYSGNLVVSASTETLVTTTSFPCLSINSLSLNIKIPNNASPIQDVSGYLTCSNELGAWSPFSGALVATYNGLPTTTYMTTVNGYRGNFLLGFMVLTCNFSIDMTSTYCMLYANVDSTSMPTGIGPSLFTYTSAL
jgi:hypothetical protein